MGEQGAYYIRDPIIITLGLMTAVDGVGNLITGNHHYLISKLSKFLSKGKSTINYRGDKYPK